jgi:hypothetical protein
MKFPEQLKSQLFRIKPTGLCITLLPWTSCSISSWPDYAKNQL